MCSKTLNAADVEHATVRGAQKQNRLSASAFAYSYPFFHNVVCRLSLAFTLFKAFDEIVFGDYIKTQG